MGRYTLSVENKPYGHNHFLKRGQNQSLKIFIPTLWANGALICLFNDSMT